MATSQTTPVVFISYSWKPFSNKQKTIQLAERLTNDGVNVIIDEWNLSEGQDKYEFMEKMVNDPEVKRVLLICNKDYATKANTKKGGVGIESLIVSNEIYTKVDQTKFIPIIFEKDEKGEAYTPTFIKSRIFIDLSNDEIFEEEYEKLLRNIFDKPLSRRPALGTAPAYISEDEPVFLRTSHKVASIKTALINEKKNFQVFIDDYYASFIEALKDFEIKTEDIPSGVPIYEVVLEKIEELKVLRNDFIDFLETICTYSFEFNTDKFISFYEKLLEFLFQLDADRYPTNTHGFLRVDQFRFFYYELFLYTFAVLWEKERFKELGELLHTSFVVNNGSTSYISTFGLFNQPIESLRFRNVKLQSRRISPTADLIKQRADHSRYNFDKLKENDALLFYIAVMMRANPDYSEEQWHRWWPHTSAYRLINLNMLQKIVSKRYFEKVKPTFNVTSVEQLKGKIQFVIDSKTDFSQSYEYQLPSITRAFEFDKISTIP